MVQNFKPCELWILIGMILFKYTIDISTYGVGGEMDGGGRKRKVAKT